MVASVSPIAVQFLNGMNTYGAVLTAAKAAANRRELRSRAMADHLVAIYGTEKDRINCAFYHKTGACRHGDRCARVHDKPLFSQTILLRNMYVSPDQVFSSAVTQGLSPPRISRQVLLHHFDDFYADVFEEMVRYGPVENVFVCQNMADHLVGNTYVKFANDRAAQYALKGVAGRWYAGRLVKAEFSPVTDFREGKCRPFEQAGRCERGDYCHFMHLRPQPRWASRLPCVSLKTGQHDRIGDESPRNVPVYHSSRSYRIGDDGSSDSAAESHGRERNRSGSEEPEEGKGKYLQRKRWEYNQRSLP